jgi:uracil-DNA glycosylase family 4
MLTPEEKQRRLREVAAEVERCQRCALYKHALRGVPGEGDPNAAVMLIGEAPGWHENQQGRPFVGAAGQFLEQLLHSVGLRRDQVFIANVIKHRPPDNRDPLPEEIEACNGYLDRQIEAIDPKVIVTLGRFSLGKFFPGERISRIHGVPRRAGTRIVLPMYHPAAALHQSSLRRTVEEDFKRLPAAIAEAERLAAAAPQAPTAPAEPPRPARPPHPAPKQLTLF